MDPRAVSKTAMDFERAVRRTAGAMWPTGGDGSSEIIAGTQIDAVFRTDDIVHLIEITIEKDMKKVRGDLNKLISVKRSEEKRGRLVKCWMIVRDDPTPHQKTAAREDAVELLTLDQFSRKLIDCQAYIDCRLNAKFGSSADPITGSTKRKDVPYHPLPLVDSRGKTVEIDRIAAGLTKGEAFVLLGDYGSGKSLTLREVFLRLQKALCATGVAPVAINLRDHWAQRDGAEVLERHAKLIGFGRPDQLVRAWRAGHIVLLLDGYDELAVQPWSSKPSALREVRRQSVAAVADLVGSSNGCGILLAGREQFFDSVKELSYGLDLPEQVQLLRVAELNLSDAQALANTAGFSGNIPDWVPKKPLLIIYLIKKGLIQIANEIDPSSGFAAAWRDIVKQICRREAFDRSMDPSVIEQVLETLATISRRTIQGEGPLGPDDLRYAFRKVTGSDPEYATLTMMLRLPGLVARGAAEGDRSFADPELLDALRAGDVVRFAQSPHKTAIDNVTEWRHALGPLGADIAALQSKELNLSSKSVVAAAQVAAKIGASTLALDLIAVAQRINEAEEALDCRNLYVTEGKVSQLNLEDWPVENLTLHSCEVGELRLPSAPPKNVAIDSCLFDKISGVSRPEALPGWVANPLCEDFDGTGTTAAILALDRFPLPVRVALSQLKKIHVQAGRGRVEGALSRGLDDKAKKFAAETLHILRRENLVTKEREVWHPVRSNGERARRLLSLNAIEDDPIYDELKKLEKRR